MSPLFLSLFGKRRTNLSASRRDAVLCRPVCARRFRRDETQKCIYSSAATKDSCADRYLSIRGRSRNRRTHLNFVIVVHIKNKGVCEKPCEDESIRGYVHCGRAWVCEIGRQAHISRVVEADACRCFTFIRGKGMNKRNEEVVEELRVPAITAQ